MDDDVKQAFERMDERFDTMGARLDTMMELMNNQHERLLERMNGLSRDFLNTKGFLIDDALTLGRRLSNVENRLDDLERGA